jgi:hypothetical protein
VPSAHAVVVRAGDNYFAAMRKRFGRRFSRVVKGVEQKRDADNIISARRCRRSSVGKTKRPTYAVQRQNALSVEVR